MDILNFCEYRLAVSTSMYDNYKHKLTAAALIARLVSHTAVRLRMVHCLIASHKQLTIPGSVHNIEDDLIFHCMSQQGPLHNHATPSIDIDLQ